jgi:phosphoglycerate dehydrogenase-like enzyme
MAPVVLYWPRIAIARAALERALRGVEGLALQVCETLDEVLAALPSAQGLVLPDAPKEQAARVLAALAEPGRTLRWMHFITAGRNGFEAAGGVPVGVEVTGSAGAVAPTVAEHAMALLLALGRRLPDVVRLAARAEWDATLARRASSLEGGTLLVVGLGHIGQEVAKRARPFGMRVEAVTRTPRPAPGIDAVFGMDRLHERLAGADAIVLCAALTPETERLVDAAALARCKPGALLVNVGRGGLVDTAALVDALREGRLRGAGLDVTDPEPLPPAHALWSTPGAIVTPHFAGGGSAASVELLARMAADEARRVLGG